jgi:serine phosphatase RsbU (regulator of sigma subunit)
MAGDMIGVQEESLRPGERMLLYTDGLTDGVDHVGRFRVEDHADALACDDLDVALDALLGRVMHRTGGEVHDDLTALLLSRRRDAGASVCLPSQLRGVRPPG